MGDRRSPWSWARQRGWSVSTTFLRRLGPSAPGLVRLAERSDPARQNIASERTSEPSGSSSSATAATNRRPRSHFDGLHSVLVAGFDGTCSIFATRIRPSPRSPFNTSLMAFLDTPYVSTALSSRHGRA